MHCPVENIYNSKTPIQKSLILKKLMFPISQKIK